MSELRKATADHPYFLTMSVVGWIDLFTRERYNKIIVDSLEYCIKEKELLVHEYVIMPSHIHFIMQHLECNLPNVIRDFKSFTAKEILTEVKSQGESRKDWLLDLFRQFAKKTKQNKEFMVWQKTNHPVELSNSTSYDQKVNYIYWNPVKGGYVTEPQNWKYSSACEDSPLELS